MTQRICSVPACENVILAREFCGKHYQRWKKYGDPSRVAVIHGDDERRFWSKVDRSAEGCWLWTGAVDKNGYGRMQFKGKSRRATRLAWYFTHGEIPPRDLYVCHSCDTPPCVNPAHLWLGTNDENMADCTEKGRRPQGDRNGTHTHPDRVPRRDDRHARSILTGAQVAELVADYAAGARAVDVAAKYGVGRWMVTRLAREAGLGRGRWKKAA